MSSDKVSPTTQPSPATKWPKRRIVSSKTMTIAACLIVGSILLASAGTTSFGTATANSHQYHLLGGQVFEYLYAIAFPTFPGSKWDVGCTQPEAAPVRQYLDNEMNFQSSGRGIDLCAPIRLCLVANTSRDEFDRWLDKVALWHIDSVPRLKQRQEVLSLGSLGKLIIDPEGSGGEAYATLPDGRVVYLFQLDNCYRIAVGHAGHNTTTPASGPSPTREDTGDWPEDWLKNQFITIEAHLDERQDDEFGHAVAWYVVAEGGYSMNMRAVYNWAFQASQYHRLTEEEMAELWIRIKSLPREEGNVPRDKRLVVKYKEGEQWISRTYRWDILPQGFDRIFDLIGGERFETKGLRGTD